MFNRVLPGPKLIAMQMIAHPVSEFWQYQCYLHVRLSVRSDNFLSHTKDTVISRTSLVDKDRSSNPLYARYGKFFRL